MPPIISRANSSTPFCQVATAGLGDEADDEDGEEDGHRIVQTGFHFQQRGDALGQGKARAAEHRADRGGIGRGHRGAEQHRVGERHGGQHHDGGRDDTSGDADAGHRQGERRPQREAQHGDGRFQAALEQDHRERHAADQIGGGEVVVGDAAGAVLAGQHAEQQEDQQYRRAEPAGGKGGEDAEQAQGATDEDELVGGFHVGAADRQQVGSEGHADRSLLPVESKVAMAGWAMLMNGPHGLACQMTDRQKWKSIESITRACALKRAQTIGEVFLIR